MLGYRELEGFLVVLFMVYTFIDTFLWFNSDKDFSHYETSDPIPLILKWGLPASFVLSILYFISMFF